MAIKQSVKTGASGKQGPTIDHKTPPQTKPSPAFDISAQAAAISEAESAKDRSWGQQVYGGNRFSGAVSDTPGHRTRAALSVNNDDTDPVLAKIKNQGLARDVEVGDDTGRNFPVTPSTSGGFDGGAANDAMLRDIASGAAGNRKSAVRPSHPGMAPNTGSPSGKVEAGLDFSGTENPVRQPPKGPNGR